MASRTARPGPHSDLEVHLPPSLPEAYGHSSLQAYQKEPAVYPSSGSEGYEPPKVEGTPRRRIGRLSNRAFWALIAIALVVIIAAALGGGLGGGLSHRTDAASAAQTQSSTYPSSATDNTDTANPAATATATSVQISLTQITNPTSTGTPSTLIRDCPSSNDTIYSAQFGSTDFDFRKICSQTIINTGTGNSVKRPTISLNECIHLCAAWNAKGGTPPCQTVCWRNGFVGNDRPGICYGFQTTNSSTGFIVEPDAPICDSAVWINQP